MRGMKVERKNKELREKNIKGIMAREERELRERNENFNFVDPYDKKMKKKFFFS